MYLCIAFFFQAQTPWPGFSSQASDQGMDVMTRRECQKESEKCPAQCGVSLCSPGSRPHSKLPGTWRIKGLCTCAPITCSADFSLPAPWSSGNWRHRSGLVHVVPHLYRCTGIPLTLSQNIPISQVPITANACFLTVMTKTLKCRLEKWSRRKPDYAGRERTANMVTVSSYTLSLILQRLFANIRDNASSCSYWAMADA